MMNLQEFIGDLSEAYIFGGPRTYVSNKEVQTGILYPYNPNPNLSP